MKNNSNRNKVDFGKRLRALRKYYGYTQKIFAKKLAVNASTISYYENELRAPARDFFEKARDVTLVDLNWLISGQGEMFSVYDENLFEKIEVAKALGKHAASMEKLLEKFQRLK